MKSYYKPYLKAVLVVAVIGAALAGGWLWWRTQSMQTLTESPHESLEEFETRGVPNFSMPTIDGESFELQSLRGHYIIVNFWASWCDPCAEEFPSFLSLINRYKGKLKLVAVSNDENREDMLHFIEALDLKAPHVYLVWDPKRRVTDKFGTKKLPESYVLDMDLKLLRKVFVLNWFSVSTIHFFDELIGWKGTSS